MLCNVMLFYVMLFYVVLYYILFEIRTIFPRLVSHCFVKFSGILISYLDFMPSV